MLATNALILVFFCDNKQFLNIVWPKMLTFRKASGTESNAVAHAIPPVEPT